jgi:hypothetical protein
MINFKLQFFSSVFVQTRGLRPFEAEMRCKYRSDLIMKLIEQPNFGRYCTFTLTDIELNQLLFGKVSSVVNIRRNMINSSSWLCAARRQLLDRPFNEWTAKPVRKESLKEAVLKIYAPLEYATSFPTSLLCILPTSWTPAFSPDVFVTFFLQNEATLLFLVSYVFWPRYVCVSLWALCVYSGVA